MKTNILQSLIREQLKKALNEEYQDKYKMVGTLITNLDIRPQKEIYSDIRALPGITTISSIEPIPYNEQTLSSFRSILTVKVDGYPWITKGGFSKDKMKDIISSILKVPGVKSFNLNSDGVTSI
jgi:hypothetical protein